MQRALKRLDSEDSDEFEFPCEKAARLNLRVFLRWLNNAPPSELQQQNQEIVDEYPRNIAALTFKLRLQLEIEQIYDEQVFQTISQLVDVNGAASFHTVSCEAEVARAYHSLGQQFYCDAIDMYERVLEQLYSIRGFNTEHDIVHCCHFRLAQTYRRMMCFGSRSILLAQGWTSNDVLERIINNLVSVINSNSNTAFKPRSMIELVKAYELCKRDATYTGDDWVMPNLDTFMDSARELAPGDPYVLELCGSYCGKHANGDENRLREAIAILDYCTSSSEIRHVAWHHKGLSYVTLGDFQSAETCFENACRIKRRKSTFYIVALAKSCIRLKKFHRAEELFEEANELTGEADLVDDADAGNLYYEWAKFASRRLLMLHRYTVERVLALCCKSIRSVLCADMAKDQTRSLFELYWHFLQAWSKADTGRRNADLELMSEVMQLYEEYDQPLLAVLRRDDGAACRYAEAFIVRFIAQSNDQSHDADTALMYLTALQKSGKLDARNDIHRKMSLDAARKVFNSDDRPQAFNYALRDVFRWFTKESTDSCPVSPERGLKGGFDIYLLTCSDDDSPAVKVVMKLLQVHLGLLVLKLSRSFLEQDNCNLLNVLRAGTKSMLIMNQRSNPQWYLMSNLLERLNRSPELNKCCVTMNEIGARRPRALYHWPNVDLSWPMAVDDAADLLVRTMLT